MNNNNNMNNMKELISKLPIDIVLLIIPYTYNLQPKPLLNDIVNYTQTKTTLFELYHKSWIVERECLDPEDKNWLINDIFAYSNNYKPTMYGYVDKFYNIFKRNNYLQTKDKIDKYVNNMENKNVVTQINIFLGLLTIQERNDIATAI
jgi:hypothetical protein